MPKVFAVPVVTAALLIGLGPGGASASACAGWTVQRTPSPGAYQNFLSGVAATSASNVWAVGYYLNTVESFYQTLILHWNGTAWKRQSAPSPGSDGVVLSGVAATSATNAWAVGAVEGAGGGLAGYQTLILRWNGAAWKRVSSPTPAGGGVLNGIAAISATNAWAVGTYASGTAGVLTTLIEHWNGSAWKQVSSPNPASSGNQLNGIAAISATNAWAVGGSGPGPGTDSELALTLHWNGTGWKQVSNLPSVSNTLSGVAATSAANAWAVGENCANCGSDSQVNTTLIEQWNGTTWKQQSSPNPDIDQNELSGVAATSATNAWAVGSDISGPLMARWNGTAWKQQSIPSPAGGNSLNGITAISATNAWAVGTALVNGAFPDTHTWVLHRC